jgi:hypothetical protein
MDPFFTVVATIFVLVNGQPAPGGPEKLYSPAKFETMAQCEEWTDSQDFAQQREALDHLIVRTWGRGTIYSVECERHTPEDFEPGAKEVPGK